MKPDHHPEWQPLFATGFDYPDRLLKAKPPNIAFDCGANDGGYIATWLQYGAKEVHAFEPVPNMHLKCKVRFADNPAVKVHRYAVGEKTDTMENVNVYNAWSLAPEGSRKDITVEYTGKPPFNIEIIALDDFPIKPDFVKIDVDGYEFRVLKGMTNILKTQRPPIYFEFSHLPFFILGDNAAEMCKFIYDHGYEAVSLDGWTCGSAAQMMTMYPDGSSYDIMLIPKR